MVTLIYINSCKVGEIYLKPIGFMEITNDNISPSSR